MKGGGGKQRWDEVREKRGGTESGVEREQDKQKERYRQRGGEQKKGYRE